MLPRDVFEQFEDDFYGGCSEPPFDRLRISASWSAEGERDIEFRPPRGSYFLVLRANPSGKAWRFDSVLESARGRRHQSLHVDSTAPDELTDAQQWCSTGSGITVPDVLHVDSQNIAWTVYLVTPDGTDPRPRNGDSPLSTPRLLPQRSCPHPLFVVKCALVVQRLSFSRIDRKCG